MVVDVFFTYHHRPVTTTISSISIILFVYKLRSDSRQREHSKSVSQAGNNSFLGRKQQFPRQETTVSSAGNNSFLGRKQQFPRQETTVSSAGNDSFLGRERQFPRQETTVLSYYIHIILPTLSYTSQSNTTPNIKGYNLRLILNPETTYCRIDCFIRNNKHIRHHGIQYRRHR